MRTIISSFIELLAHIEKPINWYIREPVRDGKPLYYGLDAGYAGIAGTAAASQVIGAPCLIAQFNDCNDRVTLVAGRETAQGYCAIKDSFCLSLVKIG